MRSLELDADEADERRVVQQLPLGHLVAREAGHVVGEREADCGVVRVARLEEDFSGQVVAARPPGDLREELERALGRAEVRQQHPRVRVHDADERHAREVEAFGDHLRAQQDVRLAPPEAVEQLAVRAAARRGVEVHPEDARRGEDLGDLLFDALRSGP